MTVGVPTDVFDGVRRVIVLFDPISERPLPFSLRGNDAVARLSAASCSNQNRKSRPEGGLSILVAGGGFEPPTFGL